MKVLLAGGGTAGHINPALAIAGYIKSMRPDTRFLFIGNEGGMEQRLVPQAGYDINVETEKLTELYLKWAERKRAT